MVFPKGQGTTILAGPGWLSAARDPASRQRDGDELVVLSEPSRVLSAKTADEVPLLLEEIGSEQTRGHYVAGYVSYEAGEAFGLTVRASSPDSPPLAWIAVYPEDAVRRLSTSEREDLLAAVDHSKVERMTAAIEPRLSVSKEEYCRAIDCIREYIAAGDTYQVNYTVRARYELDIDPFVYFLALVLRQPVPYAAFLDLGEVQILSLSPELFLRREARLIESMPMKGTRPRSDDPVDDAALAWQLISSEKDRAENLMIVDMVRNDLGRVSRAGSIHVPALFAVEPYRTVWQMTSTVTGQVRRNATPGQILAATFPGASITGAPKHHTMEIIGELETEPRGVYTGTVGLFLPGGDFTCNLAIRTLVHERGAFRLGVGGGIVWDSDPEEEYQEALTKAAFALPPVGSRWKPAPARERARAVSIGLFETILLERVRSNAPVAAGPAPPPLPGVSRASGPDPAFSRYRYLPEHLDRMAASAAELGLDFDRAAAERALFDLAQVTEGALVVRLDIGTNGELRLSTRETPETAASETAASQASQQEVALSIMVSPFRTDPHDLLLTHKTTARHLYDRERERALANGYQEALFLNRLGHATEGAVTNIFARFGGLWVTPPTSDGLLPGIWRAHFLREKRAEEGSLTLADLLAADEIVVGNSVRGTLAVDRLTPDAAVS